MTSCQPAKAQTATNVPASSNLVSFIQAASGGTGASQLGQAVLGFLSDAQPFYGTSNAVVYDAAVLYNNKHIGGLFATHIPITALSTNGQIAAGAALAYFQGNWYSLSLNAQAGTTWNVPLLGAVYTSIGSGPDWNFHLQQPGAFSYMKAEKNWDIASGHKLGLIAGIGNETSVSGLILFGGLSLAW